MTLSFQEEKRIDYDKRGLETLQKVSKPLFDPVNQPVDHPVLSP